jgi:signal transduction histidine kinase
MKSSSLRWRLVGSLVLLQVVASLLALLGLMAILGAAGRFVDEGGERTVQIIGRSIRHTPDGKLVLEANSEAKRLLSAVPDLWFAVRNAQGYELRQGDVPARYVELLRVLDGKERSALDLADSGGRPAARFERIDVEGGAVNVMVQTGAPLSLIDKFKWLGAAFLVLVAPTMLITALVVLVATPFVIRRGLAGTVATAAKAEHIDIDRLETRLPTTDVAAEIQPLVAAVNRAFDRLDEGYKRHERFLADAAHELRTPIATLRIQIESLPQNTRDKPRLLRATTRLATLAEQLLDLQRLTRAPVSMNAVDLRSLCERVVGDLAPLAIMNGCSVAVDAPDAVHVRADVTSIERAVANLIQNAIEHGGEGCEIRVRVHSPATIEVSDSGPGIPEDQRGRIIEPFYRLRARGEGAGLGLHLVSEVARIHQGQLEVGSSELGGASMRLELGAASFSALAESRSRSPA